MPSSELTELQLAVMQVLWRLGSGSVATVQYELGEAGRPLATTTIATLLQRLEKQSWVRHSTQGRQFIYHPKTRQDEAARSALRRVVDSFFGGNAASVTAELLESGSVTEQELEEMRQLLEAKEQNQ